MNSRVILLSLLLTTAFAAGMPKPHVLTEDELSGASNISVEDAAVAVADIADKSSNEDIVAVFNTTEVLPNVEEPKSDAPAFLCETKDGWIAIEEIDKCIVVLPQEKANSSTPKSDVLTENELSGASNSSVEDAAVAVADITDNKSLNEGIVAILNTTQPLSNGEEPQLDAPAFLCDNKDGWIAIDEIDKCVVVLPPEKANSSTPKP